VEHGLPYKKVLILVSIFDSTATAYSKFQIIILGQDVLRKCTCNAEMFSKWQRNITAGIPTACRTVPHKQLLISWSAHFQLFMEPKVSLLCSQEYSTGPYSEATESSLHPHTLLFKIHFNIILPSMSKSPK
jgi:hypothetical protein